MTVITPQSNRPGLQNKDVSPGTRFEDVAKKDVAIAAQVEKIITEKTRSPLREVFSGSGDEPALTESDDLNDTSVENIEEIDLNFGTTMNPSPAIRKQLKLMGVEFLEGDMLVHNIGEKHATLLRDNKKLPIADLTAVIKREYTEMSPTLSMQFKIAERMTEIAEAMKNIKDVHKYTQLKIIFEKLRKQGKILGIIEGIIETVIKGIPVLENSAFSSLDDISTEVNHLSSQAKKITGSITNNTLGTIPATEKANPDGSAPSSAVALEKMIAKINSFQAPTDAKEILAGDQSIKIEPTIKLDINPESKKVSVENIKSELTIEPIQNIENPLPQIQSIVIPGTTPDKTLTLIKKEINTNKENLKDKRRNRLGLGGGNNQQTPPTPVKREFTATEKVIDANINKVLDSLNTGPGGEKTIEEKINATIEKIESTPEKTVRLESPLKKERAYFSGKKEAYGKYLKKGEQWSKGKKPEILITPETQSESTVLVETPRAGQLHPSEYFK